MKRLLATAWKFARQREFAPEMESRHCALVATGSKILGVGFNRQGWSSKQNSRYGKNSIDNGRCSIHAEVAALLRVANREDIKGSTVYVVRVTKNNLLAMSQPCAMCQAILREHGVRRAIFSVSSDENVYGVVDFR